MWTVGRKGRWYREAWLEALNAILKGKRIIRISSNQGTGRSPALYLETDGGTFVIRDPFSKWRKDGGKSGS